MKPPGWYVWVKIEANEIMEVLKMMAEGEEVGEKKISHEHPHSIWYNYFSGYKIMNWLGENGFGSTMTYRRYHLPGDIDGKNPHKTYMIF